MKIFSWDDLGAVKSFLSQNEIQFSSLTIGGFDGNHLGHQVLFDSVMNYKNSHKNSYAGVVTFSRSPRVVKSEKSENFYKGDLSTLEQKISYFEKKGFDFCVIIEFNSEIKKMSGTDFFNQLLGYCNMNFLVVGEDFRCGYKGSFGVFEIQQFCDKKSLTLQICNDVILDNQRISSSLIRDFVFNGEVEKAEKFLGRKYVFQLETSKIKSVEKTENGNIVLSFTKKNILQVLPNENSYSVKIKTENSIFDGNLIILEDEICINFTEKFYLENIKNFESFEVEF